LPECLAFDSLSVSRLAKPMLISPHLMQLVSKAVPHALFSLKKNFFLLNSFFPAFFFRVFSLKKIFIQNRPIPLLPRHPYRTITIIPLDDAVWRNAVEMDHSEILPAPPERLKTTEATQQEQAPARTTFSGCVMSVNVASSPPSAVPGVIGTRELATCPKRGLDMSSISSTEEKPTSGSCGKSVPKIPKGRLFTVFSGIRGQKCCLTTSGANLDCFDPDPTFSVTVLRIRVPLQEFASSVESSRYITGVDAGVLFSYLLLDGLFVSSSKKMWMYLVDLAVHRRCTVRGGFRCIFRCSCTSSVSLYLIGVTLPRSVGVAVSPRCNLSLLGLAM
jgi:hypothetical protein